MVVLTSRRKRLTHNSTAPAVEIRLPVLDHDGLEPPWGTNSHVGGLVSQTIIDTFFPTRLREFSCVIFVIPHRPGAHCARRR